jgi:hypothetical protein
MRTESSHDRKIPAAEGKAPAWRTVLPLFLAAKSRKECKILFT